MIDFGLIFNYNYIVSRYEYYCYSDIFTVACPRYNQMLVCVINEIETNVLYCTKHYY